MADKHMSRREMLRNIGLVGVGAWAVPVLTSLPAHAATSKKKNPCKGIDGNCTNGFTQCGSCGTDPGPSYCFEALNKKGTKVLKKNACTENVFCVDVPACTGQKDCAKGTVCITNNGCTGCLPSGGVCSPKCKGGSIRHGARKIRSSGKRTAASVR